MDMKTKAFYFATEERKLRYKDNREIVVGETHSVDGEIEVCRNGLHASKRLIDAIQYAPGNILYLVELSGDIDRHPDKIAARNRKYLAEFNATEVLQEFARKQAMINIELIKPYCSEEYNLIVKFLETGDESLRDAAYAAADAAYYAADAARSAADAADSAAYAARSAVSAADSAAYAYYVAHTAASRAVDSQKTLEQVKTEQNTMLTQMIRKATGWDI